MKTNFLAQLYKIGVVGLFVSTSFLASCKQDAPVGSTPTPTTTITSPIPKTPPQIIVPSDNKPLNLEAEIELGRHLFYDKQMSVDGSTSCASCHQADRGFSDLLQTSRGMNGQMGTRNAPGLTNVAYNTVFTWDGKFPTLEKHAPGPIFNAVEMGNNFFTSGKDTIGNRDTTGGGYGSKVGTNDTLMLFARLDGNPKVLPGTMVGATAMVDVNSVRKDKLGKNYYALLNAAWGPVTVTMSTDRGTTFTKVEAVAFTMDIIAKSIAAFERTFISNASPFDRYNSGDETAINDNAKNGFKLFIDTARANCVSCHSGYNFTDQQFHNNGILQNSPNVDSKDIGRGAITKNSADNFKYKTPTLRNVSLTGPWMHNGTFANSGATVEISLENVVRHYNFGGHATPGQDPRVRQLHLSDDEVRDISMFLMTLQDGSFSSNSSLSNPW
ncbi:MAG: cytochrome c peroxidase [bacterium]